MDVTKVVLRVREIIMVNTTLTHNPNPLHETV